MDLHHISDYVNGWFIGNFSPTLHGTTDFEVSLKVYKSGEKEPNHAQKIATEVTVVISGSIRMNSGYFSQGDIIVIKPLEASDFEAVSDCSLICVKFPSSPSDKYLVT